MRSKRVSYLSAILLALILSATAVSATVYINEFMPNSPDPEPASEWIELYNDGPAQVYLTGWSITDSEGNFTLPASVIPVGGFVVLVNNLTVFNSLYSTTATKIEYGPNATGNLELNSTNNDNLLLFDSVNVQITSIYFSTLAENVSWGLTYDGGSSYAQFSSPTPGTSNNRKPVIMTIPNQTFAEDNSLVLNLSAYITDADNDPLNLTFSPVSNINISLNSMVATFIPDANFNGIRTLTVIASDGLSSVISNTFQLNITPVNDVPTFNFTTVSFNEDSATTLSLDTYTTDPDTSLSQISWSRIGGDSNIGTSISPTRVVTFNATPNFCGLTSVIFRAADTNTTSDDATINVNVVCLPDAPVINLTAPAANANINNNTVILQWTGYDADGDNLVYEVFTGNLPTNLTSRINTTTTSHTLTGLTNGQVIWQVVVDDNTTKVNSPLQAFNILLNHEPQITSFIPAVSSLNVVKNDTQTFNVTATDAENQTLTYAWYLNGLAVGSNSPGYVLDSSILLPSSYQLICNVTDTYPSSTVQTWNVSIRNRGVPVLIGPIPYLLINEGSSGTINLNNYFRDIDNDTLTFTVSAANSLAVTISNSIATITPNSGFFGARGVIFTASDGLNSTSSNTVLIVVNKGNDAPQINSFAPTSATIKTGSSQELDFSAAASDADSDPLNFRWYINNELKKETAYSMYNLREYPNQLVSFGYFSGQVVVGETSGPKEVAGANLITSSFNTIGLTANNIHVPSQIGNNPLIFVGTPCSHSKIAELLQAGNCQTAIAPGEALIKVFKYNNFAAIVVTGYSSNEVYEAAKVLANFQNQPLSGGEVTLSSSNAFNPAYVSSTTSDTYKYVTDAGGSYIIKVESFDTSGAKSSQQWAVEVLDRPVAVTFDGSTTNFNALSTEQLASVDLVLERTAYGKIDFDQPVDLRNTFDLDNYVNLGSSLVSIDSANAPALNRPATITLYGITANNPVIYYSSSFTANANDANQVCTFCQVISYSNNQLVFHVDHFSTFAVREAVAAGLALPDSVQLGSDSENRNVNVTAQFTVSNPGTNGSVNNVKITSTAASQYKVAFSTGSDFSSELTVNLAPGESKSINVRGFIPSNEAGGKHSIGSVKADNGQYSDTAALYLYPINNLEVVSVEIDDESVDEGDSADIEPDTTLEVEVEIKNSGSTDFDEVSLIGTIYDLDNDDVEDEIDDFELDSGKKTSKSLSFAIPEDLDDDSYELEIEIEAEDEDGVTYTETLSYTLNTKKEKHQLKLDASLSANSVDCVRQTTIYVQIKNLGADDEDDVRFEITSAALGANFVKDEIEIDEDDDYRTSFMLDLEKVEAGTYSLPINVYYGSKQADTQTLSLEVKECATSATVVQKKMQTIQQKHQQLITQALASQPQSLVTPSKSSSFMSDLPMLLLIITSILTLGAIIFAVGAIIIKKR